MIKVTKRRETHLCLKVDYVKRKTNFMKEIVESIKLRRELPTKVQNM